MTNLDSILKSRDIPLPTEVCIVKAMVFPVVMYGCERWLIKKAMCQSTDAFELWCCRRCLRVPWTARRSNPSILKEISPEYSLEGLMLKVKLQYFDYLMQKADSLEKILMLEKVESRRRRGDRGWDGWMASLTQWTWIWANSGNGEAWYATVHGVTKSQTQLSDWTTTIWNLSACKENLGSTCPSQIIWKLFLFLWSKSS